MTKQVYVVTMNAKSDDSIVHIYDVYRKENDAIWRMNKESKSISEDYIVKVNPMKLL